MRDATTTKNVAHPSNRTAWFDASKHRPRVHGWYECNMPKGSWTYGEGCFCYWDGEKWIRPLGWATKGPEDKDGSTCFYLKGRHLLVDETALFKVVVISEFRGVPKELSGPQVAPPISRVLAAA